VIIFVRVLFVYIADFNKQLNHPILIKLIVLVGINKVNYNLFIHLVNISFIFAISQPVFIQVIIYA